MNNAVDELVEIIKQSTATFSKHILLAHLQPAPVTLLLKDIYIYVIASHFDTHEGKSNEISKPPIRGFYFVKICLIENYGPPEVVRHPLSTTSSKRRARPFSTVSHKIQWQGANFVLFCCR